MQGKFFLNLGAYAMRTFKRKNAALLIAALFFAAQGGHALAEVSATKHNLGSFSPYTVRTEGGADMKGGTTEICIFCHTPHNSNPSQPMWNQTIPASVYNPYASSTLVSTMTPNPPLGQPTGSSKLCLSCHDGTIAMGSLLNMPGAALTSGVFTVTGAGVTAGKFASTSASYLGTELGDDHPISFSYSLSYPSNTEIKTNLPSFTPDTVKLDLNGAVQCTSCHDPHGSANPKFLVASTDNGTLCEACHDKLYWAAGIHKTSTATWTGVGQNPWYEDKGVAGGPPYDDTPALQSCLACHRSHGGVVNKSLLRGTNPGTGTTVDEEWACLNCHNGNMTSVPAMKNIDATFGYLYKHDVKGYSNKHVPNRSAAGQPVTETALNLNNRHAECEDCHNGHGAQVGAGGLIPGNHTVGGPNGNAIGPNLIGSWGVTPAPWGAAGAAAITYTVQNFNDTNPPNLEGYLCIKCHSYYAYAGIPPNVPSGGADGLATVESDITKDMNPANMAYHPVFAVGKNQPPVGANANWTVANGCTNGSLLNLNCTFNSSMAVPVGLTTVTSSSTITCTDCHGNSNFAATDPKGAHGSNNKWMLRGNETGFGTAANFCYNCHRRDVYGDQGYTPVAPQSLFSRVGHPITGSGLTSPQYAAPGTLADALPFVGAFSGNAGNKYGILCLTCHGGFHDTVNNQMVAVHGSNQAAGVQALSQALGYRLMNGACVESYRPDGDTAANTCAVNPRTQIWFRAGVVQATDRVCNNNFADIIGAAGRACNYTCNTIASCNPN
ncbi:MAG: hypothetical protein HY884_06850 [Deltaproteobacteria bacterium]|nr:hypothetical protein [Deltaproteobacteria bacterium]